MILQLGDWKFDIDMEATMAYSAEEARYHCDCAYCRNFYATVDVDYPQLRPFLAQFGLDIEAPDELMPYDVADDMHYDGVYMVCGRILHVGQKPLLDCGCLTIEALEYEDGLHINHSCTQPCFALEVGTVILPWVLDEPMKDVVSPANVPSFLKKMWDRLLGRTKKAGFDS